MIIKNSSNFFKVVLILIVGFIIFNNDGINYSIKVLLSSFFICGFSIIKILSKKENLFSLNTIFYLFALFFLGLAPVLQFKKGVFFLGENSKLSESDYFLGNIIFSLCILLYSFCYQWFKNKNLLSIINLKKYSTLVFDDKIIILFSIITVIIIFTYFSFSFESLFQRRFLWNDKGDHNSSILSIINVLRGIPLILFIFFKLSKKNNLPIEIGLLLLVILCNFPLGISRYKIAITYMPILLIYTKPILKGKMFPITFVLLFMSVFPYLHHFRYNNDLMPEKLFDPTMFTEAHFDSYQNSVNIITNNVVTNGNQLLGTVLFFIPRSYWKSKSIGSGHVLADAINYNGFSNVAVSYFAEGYINFSYFGMFLFILILAFVNATFDYKYWIKYNESSLILKTSYLIFIPFLFFILRGSLLASVANFLGYIICLILLFFIIRIFSKFRFKTNTS